MIVVTSAVSLTVPDVGSSSRFFTSALGFREELVLDGLVHLRRAAPAPGPVLRHEPWGERSASRGEMFTSATTVSFCCNPLRAPAPWSPRMWLAALKERL
jgi:hypothetical protein